MKVRFFYRSSGDDADRDLEFFIRGDGSVWRDNHQSCESQCAVVGFEDFIMPCPEIDWMHLPAPPKPKD